MEALQERIHARLLNHLGADSNADVPTLAENIAYLIRKRYRGGLQPEDISIPIARSYDNEGYIRKAKVAIIVHNKDGDDTIVGIQVKQADLLEELEKRVDDMVFSALK